MKTWNILTGVLCGLLVLALAGIVWMNSRINGLEEQVDRRLQKVPKVAVLDITELSQAWANEPEDKIERGYKDMIAMLEQDGYVVIDKTAVLGAKPQAMIKPISLDKVAVMAEKSGVR